MSAAIIILEVLIAVVSIFIVSVVIFYKRSFTYWKKRGVHCVADPSIPFGNIADLIMQKESMFHVTKKSYDKFKANNLRHGGTYFFAKPVWVPVDLELVKDVLIKDFSHFVNRGAYNNEYADPLTANIFARENEIWRDTRAALTHAFTSGKIKMMFQLMMQCANHFDDMIDRFEARGDSINIKDFNARFTMDVIASTSFGFELNTIKYPDKHFRKYGLRIYDDTGYEALRHLVSFLAPKKWLEAVNFKLTKPDVEKFFLEIVEKAVNEREKNNVERKDLLQLLIQLKNTGEIIDLSDIVTSKSSRSKDIVKLSMSEVAAQAFVFFAAGFETSSTTATFAFLELCLDQDIQDRARNEIRTVLAKHGGEFTYEACMEMKYLEQVIKETLRKYPPLTTLTRMCLKDYKVPGSEVVIEKDTLVMIPIVGIHYDNDIYPDPQKFDPDRFRENEKYIPSNAFLSFGEGPRICIAQRFGMMQTKVALATVLKDHRITLNKEKTIFPIKFEPKSHITSVHGGVWLNLAKA